MPEPDPENGNDPYEILGVTKMDSLSSIESQKKSLIKEYQHKAKKARRNFSNTDDDEQKKKDRYNKELKSSREALDEIEKAWEWMDENHSPPLVDESISISINTDNPEVESPVIVQVNGDRRPVEDAKVEVDRDRISSKETNSSGEVQFTFNEAGDVKISVPTTDSYDDEIQTVEIQRKSVSLSFDNPPSSVEVNDEVKFTVNGDSGPEPGVTVTADSTTIGETKGGSPVSYSFSEKGSKSITAKKPDNDTATYTKATHTLEVSEETIPLSVRADGSDFEIGDDVIIEVTDPDDNPVENAKVTLGEQSEETNPNGRVRLPLKLGGSVKITATKSVSSEPRTYEKAETEIQVSKQEGTITIDDIDGTLMGKNDITLTIIDHTGDPLPGATVESDWGHDKVTDDNGEVTLSLEGNGDIKIEITKDDDEVDYEREISNLNIQEYTRTLKIDECPDTAAPGDTIEVRVTDTVGSPVKNAEIRCDNQPGKTWKTGPDGRATISFRNTEGVRKIWALKNGGEFTGAEADTNIHLLH